MTSPTNNIPLPADAPKVAIIGTGIAGLGCAHFLQSRFDLTLYEQNTYAGGHTNTVSVDEAGRAIPIDTGFMVYNKVTYPNLTRLFNELGVESKPTNMSFSVQHLPSGIEYNGSSLNHLFGQRANLLKLRFWRMLIQINRFNSEAIATLNNPAFFDHTIGQYVRERGYGDDFLKLYLVPMSSAVWSTPPDAMLDFPAATLLRFFFNHGFLGLHTQHPWLTVANGSKSYVEKITAPFRHKILLNKKAIRVVRSEGKARVLADDGSSAIYDKVIFASHANQTLEILADARPVERQLLGEFKYQPNTVTLHTDHSVMPATSKCWAAWNYRIGIPNGSSELPSTHYWMNRLQNVSKTANYFVSLNYHNHLAPDKILRRIEYEHPLFNLGAIAAQKQLPLLNGEDGVTYFCGSYFNHGFHEDGFTSGLDCARAVTGEPLWA